MALQKEYTLPTGVTGNYWKVSSLEKKDYKTNILLVKVELYLNKQARDDDKHPLFSKQFNIKIDNVESETEREDIYNKLKEYKNIFSTDLFFDGALDV